MGVAKLKRITGAFLSILVLLVTVNTVTFANIPKGDTFKERAMNAYNH
jgi:hypothetical protein